MNLKKIIVKIITNFYLSNLFISKFAYNNKIVPEFPGNIKITLLVFMITFVPVQMNLHLLNSELFEINDSPFIFCHIILCIPLYFYIKYVGGAEKLELITIKYIKINKLKTTKAYICITIFFVLIVSEIIILAKLLQLFRQ